MKGINKKRYVQEPTSFKKRLLNIFLSFIIISPMVVVPDLGFAADRNLNAYLGLTPVSTTYYEADLYSSPSTTNYNRNSEMFLGFRPRSPYNYNSAYAIILDPMSRANHKPSYDYDGEKISTYQMVIKPYRNNIPRTSHLNSTQESAICYKFRRDGDDEYRSIGFWAYKYTRTDEVTDPIPLTRDATNKGVGYIYSKVHAQDIRSACNVAPPQYVTFSTDRDSDRNTYAVGEYRKPVDQTEMMVYNYFQGNTSGVYYLKSADDPSIRYGGAGYQEDIWFYSPSLQKSIKSLFTGTLIGFNKYSNRYITISGNTVREYSDQNFSLIDTYNVTGILTSPDVLFIDSNTFVFTNGTVCDKASGTCRSNSLGSQIKGVTVGDNLFSSTGKTLLIYNLNKATKTISGPIRYTSNDSNVLEVGYNRTNNSVYLVKEKTIEEFKITSSMEPDLTPPTQQPTIFTKTHNSITVQMNASDTGSGVNPNSYEPVLYSVDAVTIAGQRAAGTNTYTFTGLTPNRQYFFKYRVKDNEGNEIFSPLFEEVWTYGIDLTSVTNLRYEMYDAILKGTPPPTPAGTKYKIQLRPASGPSLESPLLAVTNLNEIRMTGMRVEIPEVPYTVYHAAFNDKGESKGWVNSGLTVKIEDKTPPESVGTMIRKTLTHNSYSLEILGASDGGVGLDPTSAYSFTRKSQNGALVTTTPNTVNTVAYTGLLPNERYENIYSVKDRKGNTAEGNSLIFYTLGIPARNAEVIAIEGTSARFKLHLEPNPNGTRYVLKLVNPNVSQVLSNPQLPSSADDIKMTGILPELEYELFVAPLNDENVEGTFKQMLYPVGHAKAGQKVTVKGELIIQLISTQDDLGIISDKVSKTYSAKIQAPMTTPADLYLAGGGKEILVKKNILGDYAAIDLKAKLIKGSTQPTVTRDNDVLEVTVPVDLADGLHEGYKFVARSSVAGKDFSTGEFKFRVDTTPPETINPTLNYISNTQAQLILDMDSTTDNMSPKNQIMLRYKGKTYSISATIPVEKDTNNQVVFELVDNIGNTRQYTLDWEEDEYEPPGLGGTDDGKKLTEDDANNDDLVQTISLPDEGQYYQVSFDGVQWSPWMVKPKSVGSDGKAEALVTLPSGDGKKTVYVRTGDREEKTTPMYVGTDTPQEIPTLEYSITPLQQMPVLVKEPTIDLTAPSLEIGTEDGLNIARDGKLDLYLTVSDNIDRQPKVKIEVFGRDEATGALSTTPLISQGPIDIPIDKKLTISLDLSALPIQTGKNYPYVLKVTAEDKNKNRTVETFSFYMK